MANLGGAWQIVEGCMANYGVVLSQRVELQKRVFLAAGIVDV